MERYTAHADDLRHLAISRTVCGLQNLRAQLRFRTAHWFIMPSIHESFWVFFTNEQLEQTIDI